MKILHLSLQESGKEQVSLRYFWDQPTPYQEHTLSVQEIEQLVNKSETDYYTRIPVDYKKTGQVLYNWLDQSDRLLENAVKQCGQEGFIIAIATGKGLAQLPWELLHDGEDFLLAKTPPLVVVRWVYDEDNVKPITYLDNPQNRPLNLLFMATSPQNVKPDLNYEKEEVLILEATQRSPLDLRVEDSGCLEELKLFIENNPDPFDVVHLTGHARFHEKTPCFLTEDEYGDVVYSDDNDIRKSLGNQLPPLIFLSGCSTGRSDDGIPSLAEKLIKKGAFAVMGWGDQVNDNSASLVARIFYKSLSQGNSLRDAIAETYRELLELIQRGNYQGKEWHKLRLYVGDSLPGALVTRLRTPRRKKLSKSPYKPEKIASKVKYCVATRRDFVGRRRQLQNCLRTLKTDLNKVGVLIQGMGGLGKSSIAIRLKDRLGHYQAILWHLRCKPLDEGSLIQELRDQLMLDLGGEQLVANLENNDTELKYRLARLFKQLDELGKESLLLILDDFEWSLEPRQGRYILKSDAAVILGALVWAISETGTSHKIIITCRYNFEFKLGEFELLDYFDLQGLDEFKGADLEKKLSRLKHFDQDEISKSLLDRALELAAGNPRLLEYLDNEVLSRDDVEEKLTELEQNPNPQEWQNQIIWPELYEVIDKELRQVLSYCLVYNLPVPMFALEAVCKSLPNYQAQLQRGEGLSLIGRSGDSRPERQVYQVSRILPQIMPEVKLPEAEATRYQLFRIASQKLHELWGKKENRNREEWAEIFRIAFSVKDNPQRFREEFQVMLDVQYHSESDRAYEQKLRRLKDELSSHNLCQQLEEYLKAGEWRKADEETAWIWYQLMILNDKSDFYDLARNFPQDYLKEMDDLWIKYSDGKFGFSVQKKIYLDLGGTTEYNDKIWDQFGECVGWKHQGGDWLNYNELSFELNAKKANLPCLPYSRGPVGVFGGGWVWGLGLWLVGEIGWGVVCGVVVYSLFSSLILTFKY
jgi:CHAT domain-containing protein